MRDMTVLPMPVALPLWGLASFKVTRPERRSMLGEPHYVETDHQRTCGGEEDAWAYTLPSGQRVIIILDVTPGRAELCGDPPELAPILEALYVSPGDPRLARHAEPFAMS